jgi:hypothetical protein
MADRKKIKDLSTSRTQVIQGLLDKLENKVQAAQRGLLKLVLEDFLDGMETDEAGNIKNTLANKRRFSMFDTVFNRYIKDKGLEVVKTIAEGVGRVADFNQQYFSVLDRSALLAPIHDNVRETLGAWLGLNSRGNVAPNGYLDTLLKDSTVKNTIKNIALKGVISQNGYNDLKKTLALHIEGNQEQTGALQRYYRNFAYDTYSITDRTAAKIYADKLKFNFAIYEGGLIETSREFCEEHNGKVYSREEIGKMKPTKAIPPGYDPFTDMGGYGCRHHWNWVPDAVAYSMRPELRNQPQTEKPAEQITQPVEKKKKPTTEAAPKTEPAGTKTAATKSIYKKFETVPQGKEQARQMLESFGLKIEDVTVDASMTAKKFNAYVKQLGQLVSEYDIFKGLDNSRGISLKFKSEGNTNGYVVHTADAKNILRINFGHKVDNHVNRNYQEGGQLRPKSRVDFDNNEISTLTHEFAHALSISEHGPMGSKFWPELEQIRNKYMAEVKTLKNRVQKLNDIYLGHYGSTNIDEFFAEAFTEYKLSSKPSKYSKQVGKLVDLYFKKVSK